MAENKPPDLDRIEKSGLHHEPDAVDTRSLTRFGIGLALGLVVALFAVWFVFDAFRGREAAKGPPPSQGLDVDARRLPPEPRLQAAPVEDLQQMRAAEDQILNSYAWLDREQGVARIPVDRAMDLLVQEGLPARAAAAPPASQAIVPTESGLGPIMTQVGGPLSPNRTFPPVQPLEIYGTGNPVDGRQAGGAPTPAGRSLANPVPTGATPAPQGPSQ